MKIVYAERARRDISEIFDDIAKYSPASARRVEAAIRIQCERLADFPYAAATTDEPRVFRVPLIRYPYTVYYRVNLALDRIEVARVIHGARIKDLQQMPDE
jgi:toxin ParE1/3/4